MSSTFPLLLFTPPPCPIFPCPCSVLGKKAIAPLHRCWVAEPELLLCSVRGVRAHTADIGGMLCAALDAAPSLIVVVHVAGLESKGPPDRWCCCSWGVRDCPRILFCCYLHHTNPLLVFHELVHELAKELVAACHLVSCMNHLLEKGMHQCR